MKRNMHADRPPPLKLHKQETHQKFRRPPLEVPPVQYRQPVIIHTYSPEIIKTDPNDFMRLVQKLTGPGSPQTAPLPQRPRVLATSEISRPPAVKIEGGACWDASGIDPGRLHESATANPEQFPLPIQRRIKPELPRLSTRDGLLRQVPHDNPVPVSLPPNSLLSPHFFDFSPSLLPSPSTFGFDFPSLHSPLGLPSAAPGSSTPGMSLPNVLPSPGPLTSAVFADLPPLSPAAYKWIERNAASADAILSSRPLTTAGLPPRPPGHFPLAAIANADDRLGLSREQ